MFDLREGRGVKKCVWQSRGSVDEKSPPRCVAPRCDSTQFVNNIYDKPSEKPVSINSVSPNIELNLYAANFSTGIFMMRQGEKK